MFIFILFTLIKIQLLHFTLSLLPPKPFDAPFTASQIHCPLYLVIIATYV